MKSLFGRERGVNELRTQRLRLLPITPEMLTADAAGRIGEALKVDVTAEWPPKDWEPHVLELIAVQLQEHPETMGWHRYVVLVDEHAQTLVGCLGGFPKAEGAVEIGYSTLPEFQRRGIATEGVAAFVDWLLMQKDVKAITAQTYAGMAESVKIMERCGLRWVGDGDDPGTVRYRRER